MIKKPNITEEEWSKWDHGDSWLINSTEFGVYVPKYADGLGELIFALPKLLDALITSVATMEVLDDIYIKNTPLIKENIQKAKQTLLDAGCTFEEQNDD